MREILNSKCITSCDNNVYSITPSITAYSMQQLISLYILDDICFSLLLFPQQWQSLVYLQVLMFGIICVWLTVIGKCCVINLKPNSKLYQSQLRIIVLRYIIEVFTPHTFYFLFFFIFYLEVTFVWLTSFSLELMCVYLMDVLSKSLNKHYLSFMFVVLYDQI